MHFILISLIVEVLCHPQSQQTPISGSEKRFLSEGMPINLSQSSESNKSTYYSSIDGSSAFTTLELDSLRTVIPQIDRILAKVDFKKVSALRLLVPDLLSIIFQIPPGHIKAFNRQLHMDRTILDNLSEETLWLYLPHLNDLPLIKATVILLF